MEAADRLRRWRLILGAEAKKRMENMDKGVSLTDEDLMMDMALNAIYNKDNKFSFGSGGGSGHSCLPRIRVGYGFHRRRP